MTSIILLHAKVSGNSLQFNHNKTHVPSTCRCAFKTAPSPNPKHATLSHSQTTRANTHLPRTTKTSVPICLTFPQTRASPHVGIFAMTTHSLPIPRHTSPGTSSPSLPHSLGLIARYPNRGRPVCAISSELQFAQRLAL
jgi:hypothetical protein